jgi:hypothetical protein
MRIFGLRWFAAAALVMACVLAAPVGAEEAKPARPAATGIAVIDVQVIYRD